MRKFNTNISQSNVAKVAGLGLLLMFFLAIFAEFVVLSNIIVPGNTATTTNNIKANQALFYVAIACYLIILTLDVVVALALYIVLKPANRNLALLSSILRLLYTAIALVSYLALAFLFIDTYNYGVLIAYIFFIPHIFVLGYVVFKSVYLPTNIGILLIIASLSYIFLLYGHFFIPKEWYNPLSLIFTLLAIIGELSIALWLLLKGAKISETNTSIE
ncbi:MAG: DUF4386 domain-containing protein [Candidatus Hermodarchaeota archaeon]